ncbi:MAG TPA: hypothetical protein VGF48_03005 [Thermoanaerobaculia bacterium]|jgi:hypothetical protein
MNVRTFASRLAGVAVVLLMAAAPLSATTYTANTSGDFHTAANYSPSPTGPFTGADDIIVSAGVNLTLTQAGTTTVKSITFSPGGSSSVTVSSGATLSVTGTNANTFGVEFGDPGTGTSEIVVATGATLSVSNTTALYGAAGGVSKVRSTGGTIQTAGLNFGGTNPLNAVIDLTTGGGTFQLTLNSLPAGGTINAGTGSTFEITGSATTQTVGGYTFDNFKINKSNGSAVLLAPITVNGNLNVSLGTFATNGNNATVAGHVLGNGSINMAAGGDLRISGDFSNTGTFTAGTGTVKYEGGGSQTLRGTTYNILAVINTNTNALMNGNVTTNGLLVDTGAYLGVSTFALTVTGSAIINNSIYSGGGTMNFTGAGGTISGSAGLIGPHVTAATRTINAGSDLNFLGNLTISSGSTITNNGNVDVDGSLIGLAGTSNWTNAANSSLKVGGNVFTSFGTLTASASGNSITYDGGNQSLFNTTYHHLVLTSTIPAAKSYSAASLNVQGDLTVSGQSSFTASSDLTVLGDVSITTSATFNAGTSFNHAVGGDWTRSGTFLPGSSTVNFNGTSAQNISASPFWSVIFAGSGAKTLTGALDIGDDVSITATVNAGSWTHNVGGTWSNSGTFNHDNGQVIFDPTSPITVGATTFYDLTIAGPASVTLNGAVNVGNDLHISGGDLQLNGFVVTVTGKTLVDSGTFIGIGTGTLAFNGDVVMDGSITSNPGGTVKATGTANQNWSGGTAPAFENLWIDKSSGTLSFDVTCFVSATLTLDGILDTNAIVNINSTGSIVRTSGWIDGRLSRATAGPGATFYPLGTTLGYAPVTVTVGSAGTLDVEIVSGPQPNNSGSNANLLQSYWTIYPGTVTGNVDLTFNWTAAMENGTPASYVLGRYDGAAWSQPGGTVGAQTASITGVGSYAGDWTAGDPASVGGATIFEVTGSATATAGSAFNVTITAKDGLGNVVTSYAGDKTILMEGAMASPDGTDPTATDKTAADVVFGNNTVITFTAGVGTTSLKLYADETVFIEATETSGPGTPTPLSIVVTPAAPVELAITDVSFLSTPFQNAPFDVEVTALDQYENPSPVLANTVVQLDLSNCGGCTGTLGGNTTVTLFAGAATDSIYGVTYSAADAGVILTATRTAGDTLTAGNSSPITFAAQVSGIVVTTDADSGAGSLREALTRNNSGECASPCSITFNIVPPGAHEIVLTSDLPTISSPATIDGTSQPGYTGTPIIAVDGSGATSNGFNVEADSTTIKGLIIHSFTGAAIELDTVSNAVVQGNWIGTDLTGNAAAGNLVGLYIGDATNVLIGGSNAGEGNVISGNTFAGIDIHGSSSSVTVAGNSIGTNPAGTAAIPNDIGVSLEDSASNNTIGGSISGHRNVISGNSSYGIYLEGDMPPSMSMRSQADGDVHAQPLLGANVNANAVKNNYIGTNAAGSAAIGNGIGINIEGYATANVLGATGSGNVISGNLGAGIVVDGSGNNDNFIRANLIGVAADGVSALGNGGDGIEVLTGSPLLIGGIGGGDANTIAYNSGNGVTVANNKGVEILGNSIHGNTALGIDLGDDGNDAQDDGLADSDIGANGKQNYPVIGSAQIAGGNVDVAVSMNSASATTAATALRVQFFEADSLASGEGKIPLAVGPCLAGNTLATTITVPAGTLSIGDPIVATATSYADAGCTNVEEGTSEFSPAATAAACTPPTANVTPSGATTFCTGGSVNLTASSGASWLWSNGATTQTITVTTGGNYSVTVTNASGCSATSAATTVTVNPIPTATISASGATTFCAGGSVTLTANASDSYLWSTGATTQSIVVTAGGSYSVQVTQSGCTSASSTPVTVTVNPAPIANITASGPTTFCTGGSVILTASNGDSWLWSNGASSQSITVSASGNYSVAVTQSGCTATSAATTVTVNPIPTATITASGATTFCTGGSVTLTANASDSYLWSNGAITQSIVVTASGTYTVQVTQSGCTSTASAPTTVTVNPIPTATITASGATTFCTGGSVTLTANTSDSYLWSTGDTTQSIVVTAGGNYTVQVTQSGCTSSASAPTAVTVNPIPTATITASGATTFCTGGSVTLTANASDSYLWSTGQTTQSIVVSTSGSYTVQVTQSGCTSASSAPTNVTVNPPPSATITAGGPTTFCAGGSVTLTASNGTSWLWSNGATTQSITVTTSGNYSVAVTQSGCTATSAPTTVNVTPAPAATITPSGSTSFCDGGSVTLNASNGDSWLWSNGATTQSIVVSASGNYSVTVTQSGCSATSAPTPVTVSPAPSANVTASGPTTFCSGGSVTLTATSGATWLWSNGETTQSIVVTTAGSYSVTVTDGAGCTATSAPTVVTVSPTPDATITGPTSTCAGVSVTLTAGNGASWLWSTGETTQSITVTPSGPATYSVTVTTGSCSATDSHAVSVSATPAAIVTAPPSVCANSTGNTASVASQSGATYAWTISGGTITAGASSNVVTFTAGPSGNVLLGVTVVKASCTSTGNASVPVTAALNPTITGPTVITCGTTTFTLDAGAGYSSYLWSNGATTRTITVTQSAATHTYGVTVTSGSCSASDTHTVNFLATPGPAPIINAPSEVAPLSSHNASVFPGGSSYLWTITNGTITAGQGTSTITFTAGSSGSVFLDVAVGGTCPFGVQKNISITGSGNAEADLVVTKSGPSSVNAGATFSYTINVTNNGPDTATGLEIVDELPAGTTLVNVESGFRCTTSPNAVFCTGSGLLGAMSPIVITVTAPNQPGTITNTARVSSLVTDPNPGNNSSSVTTTVTGGNCGTPAKPIIIAPADGATGLTSPVAFSWTAVPQAIGYRLFASVNGAAPQQLGETDGALTLAVAVPSGALTTFVEALFNGCPPSRSTDVRITVNASDRCGNRALATPAAPANNSTVGGSVVNFQWLAAANADGYRVWVSTDNGTAEAVGETLGETSLTATLSRGTVQWWVEALYDGCASTESQRSTFTIPAAQQCGTDQPALVSPAAGANLPAGLVTFSWTGVANAISYELWLAHENGTPTLVRTVAAPATSVQEEVPAGAILWYVRVLVDRCPARESDAQRFNATQPSSCATNDRPLARLPVDGARVSTPVTFTWSEAKGATQYELFVAHGNQAPQLVATTTQTVASGMQLSHGRKRWFVRASFGGGCPPLESSEQLLEVVPQPAACSTLEAPVMSAPGQISSGVPFSVLWTPAAGATTYQLEIADNAAFANAESVNTNATQHELTRTNNGTTPLAVYTRVRAVDTRCNPAAVSPFGATLIFILPSNAEEGAASAGEGGNVTIPLFLGSELAGQTFVATPAQPWLTVTPSNGVVPPAGITLSVSVDSGALPLGTTLGGVTITTNAATGSRVGTHASSSTTPISISIVTPVSPTPKNTPPPDALIIPAVAHADGVNAKFQSDVRVSNTSPKLIKYQLTFIPSGDSGITQGKQTTFSIDPGRTIALDDILKSWFGTGSQSVTGVLEVRPLTQTSTSTSSAAVAGLANLTTFASSRTYNITANGTFGQFIPAIPFANFVGKASSSSSSSILSLQQIAQSDRFRTNLGFVEGSGQPAALLVTVFGSNGARVTSFPVNLTGGQHLQLNSFLASQGITSLSDGRVEVQVTSSTGKVTAYASVVDNETADPLLVTPVTLSEQGQTKWVVPGVADLSNGLANWQTDMRIFNAGTTAVDATLTFYSQAGGEPVVKTVTIPAGQVQELDKTLASVFGKTNDGGAVHISTSARSRLIATARTYNLTSKGTYGQFISAVTTSEAAGVGTRPLQLLQLEESDRYRSNIGFAEVSGKPVTLEVGIVPPEGKTTAFIEVKLAANEFRQLNSLLASAGLRDTHNARITVRAISGEGRAAAYASVVDMETQDPTYIPAQ